MLKKLELLLPPLPLTLVLCAMIILAAMLSPELSIVVPYSQIMAFVFWGLSAVFVLPAALSFIKAKTTVDPRVPEKSKQLVINGLYKISRNPMYLGFLCMIIGTGFFYTHIMAVIFAILFVPYMNRFQISLEEQALKNAFGDSYIQYCQRVRRWL